MLAAGVEPVRENLTEQDETCAQHDGHHEADHGSAQVDLLEVDRR